MHLNSVLFFVPISETRYDAGYTILSDSYFLLCICEYPRLDRMFST